MLLALLLSHIPPARIGIESTKVRKLSKPIKWLLVLIVKWGFLISVLEMVEDGFLKKKKKSVIVRSRLEEGKREWGPWGYKEVLWEVADAESVIVLVCMDRADMSVSESFASKKAQVSFPIC